MATTIKGVFALRAHGTSLAVIRFSSALIRKLLLQLDSLLYIAGAASIRGSILFVVPGDNAMTMSRTLGGLEEQRAA